MVPNLSPPIDELGAPAQLSLGAIVYLMRKRFDTLDIARYYRSREAVIWNMLARSERASVPRT